MFHDIEALKEAGFWGFDTVKFLLEDRFYNVPRLAGVYLAVWDVGDPTILEESPATHLKGRDPTISADTLYERWIDGTVVLYIGKAGGPGLKATLQSRINQFLSFGQGVHAPHWGGRCIWQLLDSELARICWKTTPEGYPARYLEAQLIQRFQCDYPGRRPFANLRG